MAINYFSKYFKLLDSMPLTMDNFHKLMIEILPEYSELNKDTLLEIAISLNAPFYEYNKAKQIIDLNTRKQKLKDCKLCFVDIESTSPNIQTGQIIEIGAIITQDEKIIDTFETFIYSPYVPNDIVKLTGIESYMLEDAPKIEKVLNDFRGFIGDCIFVAHNVNFDYNFISESLRLHKMPPLLNARLCTLELSRKSILSKKYALSYLNKMLGINTPTNHRAFADALTSFELYKICAKSFPNAVKTIQDLIDFSKNKITYPQRAIK